MSEPCNGTICGVCPLWDYCGGNPCQDAQAESFANAAERETTTEEEGWLWFEQED